MRIQRVIAVAMVVIIFMCSSVGAAWDGYPETEATTISVMDFDSFSSILSMGAVPEMKNTVDGKTFSAHWKNHLSVKDLEYTNFPSDVPSDWSDFKQVQLKIYSEKATNAQILLLIVCPQNVEGYSYFSYYIKLDWEGWKTIKINLSDFGVNRSASWDEIVSVRFIGHEGWNLVASPESDIYIAGFDLKSGGNKYSFVETFYDEEVIEKTYKDLEGSVAVYAGGDKVVTSEGVKQIEYEAEMAGKSIMVPVEMFSEYLGAEVKDDENSYSVSLNGTTISGKSGEKAATVGSYKSNWSENTYSKDGRTYVPGEEMANALGLCAFTDGKLLLMGTEEAYNNIHRGENLGVNEENEIVSYLSYSKVPDVNSFTDEDMAKVKANWVRALVGDEEINSSDDSDIKNMITTISNVGKLNWDALIKSTVPDELFEGSFWNTSADMTAAYYKIKTMAMAYACPGGEYYHNEELKNDIFYALDWMYKYRYGKNTVAGNIWKIPGDNNWWDWDIGTPSHLIPTLLLMENAISEKDMAKYLSYFDFRNKLPRMTGANFCDVCRYVIGSSLLQKDAARAYQSEIMLEKMYLYVDDDERISDNMLDSVRAAYTGAKGAGFFTDGSYILHTLHAENLSYGETHLENVSFFLRLFKGTPFELKSPLHSNVAQMYYKSFNPFMLGTSTFRSVMGRRPESAQSRGARPMMAIFETAPCFEEEDEQKIYSIVKSAVQKDKKAPWKSYLSFDGIKLFNKVMNDDSIVPAEDLYQNTTFYNMDKVTHHSGDWAMSVSMSSSRIFNYECIGFENTTGWYDGDGRTEWYIADDSINSPASAWTTMDPYRKPGTTVDTQERLPLSIYQGSEYLSSKDFVGGVSFDGKYGTAAMWLESFHHDKDDTKSGGAEMAGLPKHKNDLTAKKSYFMFDEGFVCLGTDVNAQNNNDAEVLTIVDNVMASKTRSISNSVTNSEPYEILSAEGTTPQSDNPPEASIDDVTSTRWASETGGEIIWDLGETKELGFIDLSFMNGSKRVQYFTLQISDDGEEWTELFEGESSGTKELNEYFDLKKSHGRYVKYINNGASTTTWVSITECKIYPPSINGRIGIENSGVYGSDKITVDGENLVINGDDYSLNNAKWVNYADKCGYIFPTESTNNLGELKARWTEGVNSHFELWFSHGINPADGQYAYIQMPGKSAEETKAFAENNPIRILSNTPYLQAVENKDLGIISLVFWEAGSFRDITVSQPCMVMYREADGEYRISVSDPTQKCNSISVSINRNLTPVDLDDEASSKFKNGATAIDIVPSETTVGRTYECVFEPVVMFDDAGMFEDFNESMSNGDKTGTKPPVDSDKTDTKTPENSDVSDIKIPENGEVKVTIKDKEDIDINTIIQNDRILVPVRFVSEGLGADVNWEVNEAGVGVVTVIGNGIEIVIYINSEKAYVNEEEQILDSPAIISEDRTYVPLRFIAEALGATVEWDSEQRTATIIPASAAQ